MPPQFQFDALNTLSQAFGALNQSLAVAVIQGFVVVLVMCVVTVLFTLLLKDLPLKQAQKVASGAEAGVARQGEIGQ